MFKQWILFITSLFLYFVTSGQKVGNFNGLNTDMGNIQKLSRAESRSISAENFTGGKGMGGMDTPADTVKPHHSYTARRGAAKELQEGWKMNPAVKLKPGEVFTMADIEGPGAIQHIWLTHRGDWRLSVLRIYWDDETEPSVETPIGDFFCMGLNKYDPVNSLPISVNPGSGFNSFWTMPFRRKAKVTLENLNDKEIVLHYQINYALGKVDDDDAYFHAQFRKSDPKDTSSVYTLLDDVKGTGHFVGVYMTWKQNDPGWWGEGEIKFYIDGDKKYPTINGTGVEDYFGGSYGWTVNRKTTVFTTPFIGLAQIIEPDSTNKLDYPRYGMYRWHIKDPVRFSKDLKITMQDLGMDNRSAYVKHHSDITSVVYWYQTKPTGTFPKFPSAKELEKISHKQ